MSIANVEGHSEHGARSLELRFSGLSSGGSARLSTPTFIPGDALNMAGYALYAAPIQLRGLVELYGSGDATEDRVELPTALSAGEACVLSWRVAETDGCPIAEVRILVGGADAVESSGALYLDWLTWDGEPDATFNRTAGGGSIWRRAWVNAFDRFEPFWAEAFRVSQDSETGMLITGCREWHDYRVSSTITTDLASEIGIAAQCRGGSATTRSS